MKTMVSWLFSIEEKNGLLMLDPTTIIYKDTKMKIKKNSYQ